MRNPNGYGGICKLGGKRRKPFYVRVTIGWEIINKETGEVIKTIKDLKDLENIEELPPELKLKQLYLPVGSFKTRPEALIALAEYNKDPNSFDKSTITFAKVYERWSVRKYNKPKTSKQSIASYRAAYKEAESLHDMKFIDLKKDHLQAVIDDCENGYESQTNVKILYHQLFKYALENDIVEKDYSVFVEIVAEKKRKSNKTIFSKKERGILWDNVNKIEFVDTILIMIYTGLRPSEMLGLENGEINEEQRTMRGGVKTEAGKDRIIPINKKILPFIVKRKAEGHRYLLHWKNKRMTYDHYYNQIWKDIMDQLQLNHKPQECRHTFATLMDKAKADKLCVKRIMGHAVADITERVYTHKDIEDLLEAIDLI